MSHTLTMNNVPFGELYNPAANGNKDTGCKKEKKGND